MLRLPEGCCGAGSYADAGELVGGNDTDDDPQAPVVVTDNEAEGSGAAGAPSQHMQVSAGPPMPGSQPGRLTGVPDLLAILFTPHLPGDPQVARRHWQALI